MDKLFGLSMDLVMAVLLSIFLLGLAVVGVLAWRNRIMLKLGLRNIPRRRGQTALIIIGVMLSTVIIAAALGTGDTLSVSIRNSAIESLGTIDEIIIPARAGSEDSFGSNPYITAQRFQKLQADVADLDAIDGMVPTVSETLPAFNPRTSLSEGRLNVVGPDPGLLEGFGSFTLTTGGEARLEDLADDEVYVSSAAANELDARDGDELQVFLESGPVSFRIKGIVNGSGLAGVDPTMLITLERAQRLFDKPGQVNLISVSNRGDRVTGVELSREVARELRVTFNDREVATQLKELLSQEDVLHALETEEQTLSGAIKEDVAGLLEELQRAELSDELVSLLSDQQVVTLVMGVLEEEGLQDVEEGVAILFLRLAEFRVIQIKRNILNSANEAGSFVTTFFMTMGLFSVMVGILLIFLIFVMLAAARRSEMGMARAIGAKRRHLVQMFVFEGTAYALVSAAVGVILGLAVSALMVGIMNRIFAGFDESESFRMTPQFSMRTIVVSYSLGMVITFATVAVSAYRVSRLNIVAAVRGLPASTPVAATGWRTVLLAPLQALLLPFRCLWQAVLLAARLRLLSALGSLLKAAWAAALLPVTVNVALFQIAWRFFLQGWLAVILGILLAYLGDGWERAAPFASGVSIAIIGIGLTMRTALRRAGMRPDLRDRIAFTFTGALMLAFWVTPSRVIENLVGRLQGDFEMLFVSGVFMVAAAVWTVMYNTDLLLRALTFVTSPIGKLRPVLVTAVAYPMSAKLRTGLTLAMFALVFFTLMVMSVLTETFSTQFTDPEVVTGGWHIEGTVNPSAPIDDIDSGLAESGLSMDSFKAVGGYTWARVQARQLGGENQGWDSILVRGADDDFLESSEYNFKLIAEGYGSTTGEVMQALSSDPTLVVLGGNVVRTRPGVNDGFRPEFVESVFYDDESMSPFELEVRERLSGETVTVTVIGILEREHEGAFSALSSKKTLDDAFPFPIPITRYRFSVADGVDPEQAARGLEAAFLQNGMETEVLADELKQQAAANKAFFRLFTGFMALGLVVGIAALGVVSTRAVVERRQQIGVLRAIGYRRGMILLSFLLESSFIAILGMAIGATLGITLGYQIYVDIRDSESVGNLRFVIPWAQIGVILGLAYVFSLIATYLPARQAARIYPAEALRYE